MVRFLPAYILMLCTALSPPRGIASGPDSPEALMDTGHWKRARAILEPRARQYPQDGRTAYLLSRVKFAFSDLPGALEFAQRAVEIDQRNANYHFQLARVWGEMASRASMFAAARLAGKFKNELDAALALDPKNLEALDALMEYSYQAPGLMGGDKNKARAIADEILRQDLLRGWFAKGDLAEEERNFAQAETFYLKAVETDPKSYEAQTRLAGFYASSNQKKYELAEKVARQAIQLDATQAKGCALLAKAVAEERRWEELDKLLSTALEHVPDNLAPLYEAADVLVDSGTDLDRAETYLRKYLSQEPEGEEPDAAQAHRLLGLALEKQGRIAEARSELEFALRLRPEFREAKKDLQRLSRSK